MTKLEQLVREWRETQKVIDKMTAAEKRANTEPLFRLVAAHAALIEYADEYLL